MSKIKDGVKLINILLAGMKVTNSSETDEVVIKLLLEGGFIDKLFEGPDSDSIYAISETKKYEIKVEGVGKAVVSFKEYSDLQFKIDMIKKLEQEIIDICDEKGESVHFEIFDEYVSYSWENSSSCWSSSSDDC